MCNKCRLADTVPVSVCFCECPPTPAASAGNTSVTVLLVRKLRCVKCGHSLLTEKEEESVLPSDQEP